RRRHTSFSRDWSSDVCSSDLQYLMGIETSNSVKKSYRAPKVAYMRIGSATNSRSVIATYMRDNPAGDSVFFFRPSLDPLRDVLRSEERRVGKERRSR